MSTKEYAPDVRLIDRDREIPSAFPETNRRRTHAVSGVSGRLLTVVTVLVALMLPPAVLAQPGGEPAQVLTAPIQALELPEVISVVGTVEPARRSVVASEVAGLVEALPVRQGDSLEAGQLVCQLNATARRLELQQAQAQLAASTERNGETQALYDNWAREKQRVDTLHDRGVASDKEYRDVTTEYAAAKSRLAQTKQDMVAQQALVDRLKDALDKTSIKAPFAGAVVSLRTEVGQWVDQGGPVLEMIELATVLVRVQAPARVLPYVRVGQPCVVTIESIDEKLTGSIKHIIRQADIQARTLPIDIELTNQQGHLAAGMFARAQVPSGPTRRQLIVTRDAVSQQGPMRMVYAIRDGPDGTTVAKRVPVSLVGEHQSGVAIQGEGLEAGDQVVVRGNEQFLMNPSDSLPVIATPANPPSTAAPAD